MRKSNLWGASVQRRHRGRELSSFHLGRRFLAEVSSWLESGQAFPGVGVLPLLGEEGHGLVGGTLALACDFLMQSHALKRMVGRSWIVGGGAELPCFYAYTYHVVPSGDDELLLLFVPRPGLLVVMLCQKHEDASKWGWCRLEDLRVFERLCDTSRCWIFLSFSVSWFFRAWMSGVTGCCLGSRVLITCKQTLQSFNNTGPKEFWEKWHAWRKHVVSSFVWSAAPRVDGM